MIWYLKRRWLDVALLVFGGIWFVCTVAIPNLDRLCTFGRSVDFALVIECLDGVRRTVLACPGGHLEGTIHVRIVVTAVVAIHFADTVSSSSIKDGIGQVLLASEGEPLGHVTRLLNVHLRVAVLNLLGGRFHVAVDGLSLRLAFLGVCIAERHIEILWQGVFESSAQLLFVLVIVDLGSVHFFAFHPIPWPLPCLALVHCRLASFLSLPFSGCCSVRLSYRRQLLGVHCEYSLSHSRVTSSVCHQVMLLRHFT